MSNNLDRRNFLKAGLLAATLPKLLFADEPASPLKQTELGSVFRADACFLNVIIDEFPYLFAIYDVRLQYSQPLMEMRCDGRRVWSAGQATGCLTIGSLPNVSSTVLKRLEQPLLQPISFFHIPHNGKKVIGGWRYDLQDAILTAFGQAEKNGSLLNLQNVQFAFTEMKYNDAGLANVGWMRHDLTGEHVVWLRRNKVTYVFGSAASQLKPICG